MPDFIHQSDLSETNPKPVVGVDALAKLGQAQADSLILRVVSELAKQVQALDNRLRHMEKYETNSGPPVRNVVGDSEFIRVSQNEEHVQISFDEEELRRHNPPPMFPTYLDLYRHCTDSAANPDIYLPSGVADGNLDPDGTLVVKVAFDNGAGKCYYIWERNVLGEPTTYVSLEKVVDCTACTETPPTDPPCDNPPCIEPPGDYPVYDGNVVTDINCELQDDGALAIIVKFFNQATGETTFEQRLDCCCSDTPPSPFYLDRWRPCTATSGDESGDIFLSQAVYANAGAADPVIQLEGTGTCYIYVEEVTGETETAWTDITLAETCADTNCEHYESPPDCASDVTGLRIAGYVDGMFGQIQRNNVDGGAVEACADCGSFAGNGDSTAGCATWDGTMVSGGAGVWWAVANNTNFNTKMMKISGSQNTAIRNDTGVVNTTPGFYTFIIYFQCANTSSLTYRRADTTGPCGRYELYATSVTSDTTACGSPWPAFIDIEAV